MITAAITADIAAPGALQHHPTAAAQQPKLWDTAAVSSDNLLLDSVFLITSATHPARLPCHSLVPTLCLTPKSSNCWQQHTRLVIRAVALLYNDRLARLIYQHLAEESMTGWGPTTVVSMRMLKMRLIMQCMQQ